MAGNAAVSATDLEAQYNKPHSVAALYATRETTTRNSDGRQ